MARGFFVLICFFLCFLCRLKKTVWVTWFFFFNLFELYQAHEGCDKMLLCVCVARCSVCRSTRRGSERPTKLCMGRRGCSFCHLVELGKFLRLLWYLLSCFADRVMNERWLTAIKSKEYASSKTSTAYSLALVSTGLLLLGHVKCCSLFFALPENN